MQRIFELRKSFVPTFALVFFSIFLLPAICALAQSDDFDDGNDAGWVRFNPLSVVGVTPIYTFPATNSSSGQPFDTNFGRAYRIQSPAPSVGAAGPARAFSYRTNIYDDFYASFDIAGFDNSLDQAFGLLFRASNIGLGSTLGYVLNYDPQQDQDSGGRGQIQINFVVDEDTPTGSTVGAANLTLDPTRRYRVTLLAVGTEFEVRVYDVVDLNRPICSFHATDALYSSGVVGLFNFYRGDDTTVPVAGRADSTFDNYFVAASPSISIPPPGTPHPLANFPQVVNRSPASRTNFYPAANGISFTATTLGIDNINQNATRLILNGLDVSGSLQFSGPSGNLQVNYSGLNSNSVYDAKIIVGDNLGRSYTNEFTFDTFVQSFLESPGVEVIEAEDYNYNSGNFIDNPVPTGIETNGATITSTNGYLDLTGIPNIDFFDYTGSPPGGVTSYRINDNVGTQGGSQETAYAGALEALVNDTTRQKYANLGLTEYQVNRTEGGEWLNYTRIFSNSTYRVYLRATGRSAQGIQLEQVTSDPTQPNQTTTRLGTFQMSNMGMTISYRYVPLLDSNGAPARVTLSGTNTVRLLMDGPQQPSTQNTLILNYLVFAPEVTQLIQLQSSTVVTGPYSPELNAVIDTTAKTITVVPRPPGTRFYRLIGTTTRIRTIQISGNNLVISYE